MHLRYETGVATLVQFIITAALTFLTTVISIIGGCTQGTNADCISNALVSLILIILVVFGLGVMMVLGYAAQERRSRRLALFLIGAEAITALVYLFDAKQSPDLIERLTSFVSFLLAIWVVVLAWRLSRAKGGRVVKNRRRPAAN